MTPNIPTQDQLTLTFMALSDPTRRAILGKLAKGEATVQELSKPFDMSGPAITKHLIILEKAGLISRSREAQRRPCKLETKSLRKASEWINEYKKHWEESFDRLDIYLKTMTTKPIKKKKGAKHGRKK